jgi:hypothetical protein
VLDEFDRELERRGHRFVRYADDSNIYVRSERAGQRVMESITQFITQELKLKVNEAKDPKSTGTPVARPQDRKFLGFSFTAGPEVRRVIAPKALDRFKRRIREITRRAKGVSMETTMEELAPYMLNPLGPVATQGGYVAAVEDTAPSPGGAAGTGGTSAVGEQHCRPRSRPLVPGTGQGSLRGAFQCILQIARTSLIV